ncbi:hypothetical protein CL6EHI_074540 [Entamoeba histolytica]|uniref:Uncharacterized protein n=2 Tax=Entamoeba histolytica TaxID=5759 RepID=C4M9A3_ENTH1|nr:hypothetical protein EHI_074540 [Entamoeba histolytica HM-1:IMSS]EAL45569.1 hypothetical protein EHI_074540 [Entamoeba histolytica HM-1:IMSS]GAT98235.1 hypothetical protein CL6EHI_074540 [Entamoeba histolytica]|eukprot:XP_650955.1 hypothetical protein EHI_074540 [Entamoeba histolytica HM-1:IMSS]
MSIASDNNSTQMCSFTGAPELPPCPTTPEPINEEIKPKKNKMNNKEKIIHFIKRQMNDNAIELMIDILEENERLRKELERNRMLLINENRMNEEIRNGVLKERVNLLYAIQWE